MSQNPPPPTVANSDPAAKTPPPAASTGSGRAGRRQRRPITGRQRLALLAFSLALPMLVLGVAEASLRIAGFGGYPGLLQRVGPVGPAGADGTRPVLMLTDPAGAASYFFNNQNRPGSLNQTTFVDPKAPGTFRVFTAGESAMQGFPQPAGFASSRFLGAMLGDAWPDRRVEVINLGVTAVASFPVLEIATEALNHQADLIVVYVGNNEFFGAYGVASLNRAAASPAMIRLQRWFNGLAIAQGLRAGMRKLNPPANTTLMETMMGQTFTGPDDPIRARAAANLRAHLDRLAERCAARGVPLVICTLPSNELDLAPLGESDLSGLTAGNRDRVNTLLKQGRESESTDPAAAVSALRSAAELAPQHATVQFHLGRALMNAGEREAGLAALERATALDPMPWRPPPATNAAVRESARAAAERSPGLAALADLQTAFRSASPGGAIGWDLMDDHVHPTFAGQELVARTIVKAMSGLNGAALVDEASLGRIKLPAEYLRQLGENPYDSYGVDHTMRALATIPFIEKTNPGMGQRFTDRCKQFEASVPKEVLDVMRDWQSPNTHIGGKRPLSGMVGRAMLRLGRFADAEPLFDVASRHVLDHSAWNLEFTYFTLVCHERTRGKLDDEDLARAMAAIERGRMLVMQGRSTTGQVERFMARLHQLRGEFAEAIPLLNIAREKLTSTDLVSADQALVESLLRLNRVDEARAIIERGIKQSGQFSGMYRQMEQALPKRR